MRYLVDLSFVLNLCKSPLACLVYLTETKLVPRVPATSTFAYVFKTIHIGKLYVEATKMMIEPRL